MNLVTVAKRSIRLLVALLSVGIGVGSLKSQVPCSPQSPPLRYPDLAMEKKVSGPVSVNFTVNKRGDPSKLQVTGDPLLVPPVEWAFMRARFPGRCGGRQVNVLVRFRIDQTLSPESSEFIWQISETEYEVVSPAKNVVILADPPVTTNRPRMAQRVFGRFRRMKFL